MNIKRATHVARHKPYGGMLKIKDAIARINDFGLYHAIGDLPHSALTVEAFHMAISALEKQEPRETVDDGAFGKCPCCGEVFTRELINEYDMRHCLHCGQKLDWPDFVE